jgi:hypothetical protein
MAEGQDRDYVRIANQYAQDVMAGKTTACKWTTSFGA